MKKKPLSVTCSTDRNFLILRTPATFTGANLGFNRDTARALIADQLAVFNHLWPDAPKPLAEQSPLVPLLMRGTQP